jgi:hypothetical protein
MFGITDWNVIYFDQICSVHWILHYVKQNSTTGALNAGLCLYLKENLHKNWSCVIISFHCITNSGSGTAYPSWTPEFTPFFMFHVPRSWIFLWCCADHCLFVLFLFLIHVCIVCLSSIYSFWLTLWELPAFFLSEYQDTDVTTKFNWQYTNRLYKFTHNSPQKWSCHCVCSGINHSWWISSITKVHLHLFTSLMFIDSTHTMTRSNIH